MNWDDVEIPKQARMRGSEEFIRICRTKTGPAILYLSNALMRKIPDLYMYLGYSKRNNAIVMFFTDKHEENNHTIYLGKKNSAAIQTFLNCCQLDKEKVAGKYKPIEAIINDKLSWFIEIHKKILSKPEIENDFRQTTFLPPQQLMRNSS